MVALVPWHDAVVQRARQCGGQAGSRDDADAMAAKGRVRVEAVGVGGVWFVDWLEADGLLGPRSPVSFCFCGCVVDGKGAVGWD